MDILTKYIYETFFYIIGRILGMLYPTVLRKACISIGRLLEYIYTRYCSRNIKKNRIIYVGLQFSNEC